MLLVLVCSYGFGYLCAAVALAAENRFGMVPPRPFSWTASLGGAINAGFVLLAWSTLYFGVKYYQALEAERLRAVTAETLAREAELRALRYQIHPHFLFNTLNAISTLVTEGRRQEATRMIARLADFLRATLEGGSRDEVSLQDELFFVEQYLEIEKVRLGERLEVHLNIDPTVQSALVPHLLLQPLVENAIRHGISARRGIGQLTIQAGRNGGRIRILIADNGQGGHMRAATASGNPVGIGLSNSEKRLRQLYGSDYRFELLWPEAGGCEVLVELPFHLEQVHLIQEVKA